MTTSLNPAKASPVPNTATTSSNTDDPLHQEAIQALLEACEVMEQYRSGLAARAVDFIIYGQQAEVLDAIGELGETRQYCCPGVRLDTPPPGFDKASIKQLQDHMQRFMNSPLALQPDIARRLGQVCHACDDQLSHLHVATPIESWSGNLLDLYNRYTQRNRKQGSGVQNYPDHSALLEILQPDDPQGHTLDAWVLGDAHSYEKFGHVMIKNLRRNSDWDNRLAQPDYGRFMLTADISVRETLGRLIINDEFQLEQAHANSLMALSLNDDVNLDDAIEASMSKLSKAEKRDFWQQHYTLLNSDNRQLGLSKIRSITTLEEREPLLQGLLNQETDNKLKRQIKAELERIKQLKTLLSQTQASPELPAVAPLQSRAPVPQSWYQQCLDALDQCLQKSERSLAGARDYNIGERRYKHQQLSELTPEVIRQQLDYLATGQGEWAAVFDDIAQQARLDSDPNIHLIHWLRLRHIAIGNDGRAWNYRLWGQSVLKMLKRDLSDFRQLDQLPDDLAGLSIDELLHDALWGTHQPCDQLPEIFRLVPFWPYLVAHPYYIENILLDEFIPFSYVWNHQEYLIHSLMLTRELPVLPPEHKLKIYELATGARKTLRQPARQTARHFGIELALITGMLTSKDKSVRQQAADWLRELSADPLIREKSIESLTQAANKEKDQFTRAMMIDALRACAADIQPWMSLEALLQDAEQGLAKPAPAHMSWFPYEQLPVCRFANGSEVPARLLQWWSVLAVKIADPAGNPILNLYLDLLDSDSQKRLAWFMLDSFISQDLACISHEDAHAYAEAEKQDTWNRYQRLSQQYDWAEDMAKLSLDDVYQRLYKQKRSVLLGTATKEKGLLALTRRGDGLQLLPLVQNYLKKHPTRLAQDRLLLNVIYHFNEPAVIQFLLGISRRYRSKSVQAEANELVNAIAEQNGWSRDELADRTIQTAGLEQLHGPTEFDYGSRTLALQLSDDLKLQLLNEQGKVLKSLPQPRQDDNKDEVGEVRKWFNACKKDISTVISQQSQRLHDAMVNERHWPVSEWLEFLHQHPVMNRLLQRLIWEVQIDGQWRSFRPTEEDAFINSDDDELELPADSQIRLACGAQLSADQIDGWRAHLKDYRIKPLFDQLQLSDLLAQGLSPEQSGGKRIDHAHRLKSQHLKIRALKTWNTELRNIMEKLGYRRGTTMDHGSFWEYIKDFPATNGSQSNLTARLHFSGSYLPEETSEVEIYYMDVLGTNQHRDETVLTLAELPPNLLNAIAQDYEVLATHCEQNESSDPE